MENAKKQQSVDEHEIEDMDHLDQSNDDVFDGSSSVGASTSATYGGFRGDGHSSVEVGLTQRLTDILVDEGDGDLLLQSSNREDRVIEWLQALDLQIMGACRADERLKPLLKLNVSTGVAEDRLLSHLSQHFEPSEVGMLARCLCIPLVSIRVGKINKQGTLLCPTTTRGNLNLTLLPTSELRISFIGDDGHKEKLSTLSSNSQCLAVAVEEIPADKSGRSFLVKIPDGKIFYFWCSEKSKLLGIELLSKMKDLLKRKPSLAELTGISESRLDCFATHLRAYLVGSTVRHTGASAVVSLPSSLNTTLYSSEFFQTAHSSSSSSLKPLHSRHYGNQVANTNHLYQGSLSPRPSTFKEGLPRNLSSLRSVTREKLRQSGGGHLSVVDHLSGASSITTDASSSSHAGKDKVPDASATLLFSPLSFLESLGKSTAPPFLGPVSQVTSLGSSLLSPYYCLCPPVASTLQYAVAPPQLPISSTESTSLPPLSSLLPTTRPSALTPLPPLDLPSMDFPPFLPEPLVRLPLSMPSSQPIPTFTPLMCDPIVHIPVIDVCSLGQGYLVSAGPAISTAITPLHPNLVNPLIPETESMVEKGARETLRLLLSSSSSQTNAQLVDAFPPVLNMSNDKQGLLVTGSRGLYSGARDVDAIANSIAAMGLVSLSERPVGTTVVKRGISQGNLVDLLEKSGGSCSDDESSVFSKLRDERSD